MHIAIEGLDGAGKTSTAELLAKRTGYGFLKNPIYDLVGKSGVECFVKNMNGINRDLSENIAALFYGMGNLYLNQFKEEKNIITDRHLCATYLWDSNKDNIKVFDFLVDACGKPDLTVILYAKADIRKKRIIARDPEDPDLEKDIFDDRKYRKAIEFLERYNMKYVYLDNSYLTVPETVNQIEYMLHRRKCKI